jgi:hypothetical protein
MPRIVLQFGGKRYCLWCDEVPPPLGGGPGNLVIPNVERKFHDDPNPNKRYEYLEIPLLDDESPPQPPEDVHMYLTANPITENRWSVPENGSRMGPDIVAFSVKLGIEELEE